ncbi:polysaccharide lyase [Echinicola marina]|uniref:polysaccharide lyase n=1 Tax=Echinicola marina TaxID=2859768 RepID=UPI001CF68EB0|nr:polysaccharide lyase [Echinicola marina]UCS92972.1 polysaccharide lyase [Echinicola marina]
MGNKVLENSLSLLFEETFEGNSSLSIAHKQLFKDYSFSLVKAPVFKGQYAGRFELRDTDDMVANGTRAEVLFPEQVMMDRWYSFAVYFPEDFFQKDSYREIISQWHQGGAGSPPNSLQVRNDQLIFRSIGNDNRYKDHILTNVPKDSWTQFVFHLVHSPNEEGIVRIWMNGEKVLQLEGRNMKSGYENPRWKVGLYKWAWNGHKTTDTQLRVLYFDNIRIGNENSTPEEMSR